MIIRDIDDRFQYKISYAKVCRAKQKVLLNDPGVTFCNRVTNYMKEKIEKAQYHRVVSMGTKNQRFEVSCKDRTGRGVRRQRVVQN